MTRLFWLSFADASPPKGRGFLGVCVVEVDEDEAADIKAEIDEMFPRHGPDAEWITAATRKAWAMGCHPGGGGVLAADITGHPPPEGREPPPLYRLMQKAELEERGFLP